MIAYKTNVDGTNTPIQSSKKNPLLIFSEFEVAIVIPHIVAINYSNTTINIQTVHESGCTLLKFNAPEECFAAIDRIYSAITDYYK